MTDNNLIVTGPTRSWDSALQEVMQGQDYPPDFVDVCYRGSIPDVTAELRSLSPHSGQALERLKDSVKCAIDPEQASQSEEVVARMATLLAVDGLSHNLVVAELAVAATREGESFASMYELVCEALIDFRDTHASRPMQPVFNHDEFSHMAAYVESAKLRRVTATRTKFDAGGQEIAPHLVDTLIHEALEECFIWDTQRNVRAAVSNRLIVEVRSAFARMHPRLPHTEREPTSRAFLVAALPAPAMASTVSTFADGMLVIEPGAWTASEALLMAYVAWCQSRGMAPKDGRQFFKELSVWGAGRIHRSKRRVGGRQTPGYAGLALRAGEAGGGGHEP